MGVKRILIVDDEESILSILKASLKKLGPEYQVMTATDGFAALDQLDQYEFEVVVTDYNMGGMDGLELLESIRYIQPDARVIMITAYGSDLMEAEVRRLQAYRYLTKPLEINTFRQVVGEALGQPAGGQATHILMLSGQQYQQVIGLLEQLQGDVGASCTFLVDVCGQIIARTGDTAQMPIEEMASLLGAGIATVREAGQILDKDPEAINLAYREGKQEYLYAINVGQQLLLILVIKRTPYSSRLGTVWYHTQQAASTLNQTLSKAEYTNPQRVFGEAIDQAFDTELDKLLL